MDFTLATLILLANLGANIYSLFNIILYYSMSALFFVFSSIQNTRKKNQHKTCLLIKEYKKKHQQPKQQQQQFEQKCVTEKCLLD